MKSKWSKEPPNVLAEQCQCYFRESPVFSRLFQGFREKYRSYGSFSGTVTLGNLTEEEREILEGFFRRNFHGQKIVRISAGQFEKALLESRFSEFTPKQILEMYFQEDMTGKKEQQLEEEKQWQLTFDEALTEFKGTVAEAWLKAMQNRKAGNNLWLVKDYHESGEKKESLKELLNNGARIMNGFPCHRGEFEYLSVFAAKMTGNPHSYDKGRKEGRLLTQLVRWYLEQWGTDEKPGEELFHAQKKQRSYLQAGILLDDISNYVMLCGVCAWKHNGEIHEGMKGFQKEGDSVQVPLSVIAGWKKVLCPENEIYIVENPSVYALLCKAWGGSRACMCMNGQPRLSALLLLDLFAKAGTRIYYAGDFDPEGLLIAQKLKQYYKGPFFYWHMNVEAYHESNPRSLISGRRMKMLEGITDPLLLEVREEIRKISKAGYQENVWSLWRISEEM